MIGFSVKHIIKKTQEKMHKQLQCKLHVLKNVGKNALMTLVEKTCSKNLVRNAWKLSVCAFSTTSVKNVV